MNDQHEELDISGVKIAIIDDAKTIRMMMSHTLKGMGCEVECAEDGYKALGMLRRFKPDLIFTHSKQDVHQDRNTMTDEALRAFRGITVLGFDVVRSSYGFFPHFLVEVTEEDVNKKIEALSKYETYRDRYYFNSELTRSIMVRHGALAERPFAEGFDILRIVGTFEG